MKLLQPIKIGRLELKNRIVMTAMHLNYGDKGYVDNHAINFYRKRAEGGVGLILAGGCTVVPFPGYWSIKGDPANKDRVFDIQDKFISLGDDKYISGHRQLVNAVHEAGARIGLQILHRGRNDVAEWLPISSSAVPSPWTRITPREMTRDDIHEVIEQFASTARRVKEAGYDLVEILGGYLIVQFLSPVVNRRTDEYGGSLENRMKFGQQVIRAVRQAVAKEFPLMVRLAGSDFMPGGSTNLEARQFARKLEEAGADAFNITGGAHETRVPQITMNVPPGAFVYLAQGIKQAVKVPVVACNRINDPLVAEKILLAGSADLVGMARANLADPEMPNKIRKGRFSEIRKCVGCNQGCLDQIFSGNECTCLVNSQAGREAETEIRRAEVLRKVLVVGGGPAGMEAARVAACRGHEVILWEKSPQLGGQLLKAGAVPDRGDLLNLISYLAERLSILKVDVTLNKEAGADKIRKLSPDAIVFASGARPAMPPIPGIESANVVEAGKLLLEPMDLGRRVVILGGGAVGCETGIYIASQGTIDSDTVRFLLLNEAETVETIKKLATRGTKKVVILEMGKRAGNGLGISTRWIILEELKRLGVKILTSTKAKSIVSEGVWVTGPEGSEELIPADSVVIALGAVSQNELYEALKDEFPASCLVGDAKQVRTALEAIREGFDAGYSI